MLEPLSPAAYARLESTAARDSALGASNATNTTGAPVDTIVAIENIVIYVLVVIDGAGLVLNVLVFMVLIQVREPSEAKRPLPPASYPSAPFCSIRFWLMCSCGGAGCWRRCRT